MKQLPSILIVGESMESLLSYKSALSSLPINIIACHSAADAVEKTRGFDLILAILDFQLEDMTGHALLTLLNKERITNKVPVVFLTSTKDEEIAVCTAHTSWAVDFVSKPVNQHILRGKLIIFLELHNLKQITISEATVINKSVHELQHLNEALKTSEGKYRSNIEHSPDGVFVADEKGNYLEVNEAACRITGYSESELLQMSIADLLPPESLAIGLDHFQRLVANGTAKADVKFRQKSGALAWWSIEAVKLTDQRFLGFAKDITARVIAEEALSQTAERLALATRASGLGVWDYDILYNVLTWDDQMLALYGIEEKDFHHCYASWLAGIHPDDLVRCEDEIQLVLRGEREFDTEFRVCWPNGTVRNIRAIATLVYGLSGKPEHMIGTNWDITEQKELQEKLKSSEANFRTFFETLTDMIVVGNMAGQIIYVNEAVSHKLGYTHAELLEMGVLDLNPLQMRADAELIFSDMFAGIRDYCPLPLARKDNSLVPVETRIWFGKWDGNDCIFGLSKDLSIEQEALQKFNKIFDKNPALIAITSVPDQVFTNVNDTFLAKTGYLKAEVIGKTAEELGLLIELKKQQNAALSLVNDGDVHNLEMQIRTKSGEVMEGLFSGELLESQGEKFFLTVMVDITERKRAEVVIRESEANLEAAQRMAMIGSWEWNMVTNTAKWSKEMFHVFDIDPDTYSEDLDSIINVIHPDDKAVFLNSMEINLAGEKSASLEYRIIHRNGSVHYILADGKVEYDVDGKPLKSMGTAQDITQRKMAEQAIKVSEEKYKTMLNASPDGILITDLKGIISEVSEIGIELFGAKTRDSLLGKNIKRFVPPDEIVALQEMIKKTLNEGLAQNVVLKIRKEIQTLFAAEISATLIQGPGGTPLSFMFIIRDVSQRKKLETKQNHADRMANLGEMASGIAHEINQPLNIISLVMDRILMDSAKSEMVNMDFLRNKSDKIFDNINRIRNIIDHVKAFSRSNDDYLMSAFNLNTSIISAVSMISEQFKYLGIDFNLQLEEQIPRIVGNTYNFEQVILNLLINSKDAMIERKNKQEDYFEMSLGIKSYMEEQFVVVEVSDNGIGISNDDINNIMLPFYTTKDEGKGTGLGLSISYQIVKEMNGSIEIKSDMFEGTVIKLVLDTQFKN